MFKKTPNASNLLYTMLVAVLFVGCKESNNSDFVETKKSNKIVRLTMNNFIYITEVDSCEYIVFDGFEKGGIIHKQNCKFCLARSAK